MKKEKEQKYEFYNHEVLWGIADRNIKNAQNLKKEAMFYSLGGLILLYFAFEGYLNWLGNKISPEVWENEKDFFSRHPYRGTLGKYCYLCKILVLPKPDASKGEFQTAKELEKLRNFAVHPKAESGNRMVKVHEDHYPPHYKSNLEEMVSEEKAIRGKCDINKLVKELHNKAKEYYPNLVSGHTPFNSLISFEITDS
jgi:hypothetical protein